MQIAICDDESVFRHELREFLVDYSKSRRILIDIYEFNSGLSLTDSERVFDIVFLDYQMPKMDGLEAARFLRSQNAMCKIVFVTNYPDFVFDSFEVSPYRFYKKPIERDLIFSMLDEYIRQQKLLAPIIVNDYDGQRVIPSKNIIYLEGDGKYCNIRTTTETFHSSKTLSGVLELLPQYCFYRIHKSYAINMYYISQINRSEVLLTNGERALMGRNHIADFKQTYKNFIKNYYLKV